MRLSATRARVTGATQARSLISRAIAAIRRNNGSAWWVPDDYGLVLGPELSPTASTTAGWITNNAALSSDGVNLTVTATVANNPQARASFATTVGKTYRVSATLVSSNAPNSKQIRIGTTLGGVEIFQYDPVTPLVRTFVATTATTYLSVGNGETAVGQFSTFTNLSVREVLSASIYTDSTGTTLVSAVGDVLGLLTDRSYGSSNLGPDIKPATGVWTAELGATFTVNSPNSITLNNSVGSGYANSFNGPVVGELFEIDFSVTGMTSGSFAAAIGFGSVRQNITANGNYKVRHFVAGNTALYFFANSATTATITFNSVRKVLGNHAVQATTANKPVIARVPRKLGPELVANGDFSDGKTGWSDYNATSTVTSGELIHTSTAAGHTHYSLSTVVGRSYVVSGSVRKVSTADAYLSVQDGTGSYVMRGESARVASGTATQVVFTFTAGESATFVQCRSAAIGGVGGFDNISVREVLEWSNAIKFDGSNDLLTLSPGAVLQQSSDHWVTAAFVLGAVGVEQGIFSIGNTGNATPRIAYLNVSSANAIRCSWQSDATVLADLVGTTLASGTPYVVTAAKIGTSYSLWLNGVLVASTTATLGTTTTNTANIGSLVRTTTQFPFNGKLIDLALGQSTLTDSDRKTVERNMCQRAGITYLG